MLYNAKSGALTRSIELPAELVGSSVMFATIRRMGDSLVMAYNDHVVLVNVSTGAVRMIEPHLCGDPSYCGTSVYSTTDHAAIVEGPTHGLVLTDTGVILRKFEISN
jgi:hypothetical protein